MPVGDVWQLLDTTLVSSSLAQSLTLGNADFDNHLGYAGAALVRASLYLLVLIRG